MPGVIVRLASGTLLFFGLSMLPTAQVPGTVEGLTAIAGIRVGHYTLADRPTGCTVILTEAGYMSSESRTKSELTLEEGLRSARYAFRAITMVAQSNG